MQVTIDVPDEWAERLDVLTQEPAGGPVLVLPERPTAELIGEVAQSGRRQECQERIARPS